MRTQIASRLTRLEKSAGTGSRRLVVVERESLEAARAFLQGRPDVDIDRITFGDCVVDKPPQCVVNYAIA